MSKFPCTTCGMCCKAVGLAVSNAKHMIANGENDAYVREIAEFPYDTDDKGTCVNLGPDNKCMIYETRPDICDVEKTWEKHHKAGISKENYFISTAMVCNSLIEVGSAGDNFFINLEKIQK